MDYLNFNFEFLKGCEFNCEGCFVNKSTGAPLSKSEFEFLSNLLKDISKQSKLHIAFIGPTDFLVSKNNVEVFQSSYIKNILSKFQKITLQTTYLNISQSKEISEVLNNLSNEKIEINIIFEHERLIDPNYLLEIEHNKNAFESQLKNKNIENYGIINIHDFKASLNNKNFIELQKSVNHIVSGGIDYNLSLARLPSIDKVRFHQYAQQVKDLHIDNFQLKEDQQEKDLNQNEFQINYHSGQFFISPLFYEWLAIFDPKYKLNLKEPSYNALFEVIKKFQNKQTNNLSNEFECFNCEYKSLCKARSVLQFMQDLDAKTCYFPKKNFSLLKQMGTIPI